MYHDHVSLNLALSSRPLLAEAFIAVLLHTLRCEMTPVSHAIDMARQAKQLSLCMEKTFSLQVGVDGLWASHRSLF